MAQPAPAARVVLDGTVLSRPAVRDLLVGLTNYLLDPVWSPEQLRRAERKLGERFRIGGMSSAEAREEVAAFSALFPDQLVNTTATAVATASKATALPNDAACAESAVAAIVAGASTILTFRLPALRSRLLTLQNGSSVEYVEVDGFLVNLFQRLPSDDKSHVLTNLSAQATHAWSDRQPEAALQKLLGRLRSDGLVMFIQRIRPELRSRSQ